VTNFAAGESVGVVLTQSMGQALGPMLDYLAPQGGCILGDFVEVPLGPRRVLGVVWSAAKGTIDAAKLRAIARVLDMPPMRDELRSFLGRAADYTLTPLPAMLRLATRAPGLSDALAMRRIYRLGGKCLGVRMTLARQKVIDALKTQGNAALTLSELATAAGVSTPVIKGMVAAGQVVEDEAPRDLPYPTLHGNAEIRLEGDQIAAAKTLVADVEKGGYGTTLLKGVTGSGKTEVYLEAVAACINKGQQALVLLPEIALTAEFLIRVDARFGARPAEWHSGITMTERRRLWRMVAQGNASFVVGARSALFLPFQNLGLIIVDEEHDSSYKQEEGVYYNARDMAVLRASILGARVVLASATPSLESWVNAHEGKYQRLDLGARYGVAQMPKMGTIDLRAENLPSDQWISHSLVAEVESRIDVGEQTMLFLNRRGFAPLTLCRACGHQVACGDCDARMVEHRFLKRLMCHQCGASSPIPISCAHCKAEGKMAPVGPGVERLAEEVGAKFPQARLAVLSSDLFTTTRALKDQINAIAAGAADIIIGTQIVAKGHNFPLLTLVGVIDADLGLQGSDLRAAERTFQLINQVAGRAGRADKQGIALLQTHQPEHPVIRAILDGDAEAFWQAEAQERRMANVPPYGRMAGIILSAPNMSEAFDFGTELARRLGPLTRIGAQVFGPAPAPIARVRGRHRVRLLIKADKGLPLQAAISEWIAQLRPPTALRISIDIDPQSFL
jgi:primosomal protein N' (replication factor Y)